MHICWNKDEGDEAMSKSSSVFTRVEPELKEQAEQILSQLGIPMANAINLYLRQIVLHQGIPFPVQLPAGKPPDMSVLSPEQLDSEIQKGYDDIRAGRVTSAKQIREEMRRMQGV